MNENDKYAPTGKAMRRIADTVRFVETGGRLPDGGLKKRHRLIPHEEGVLLDDLLGTDDPNVPTTARFQIKSPHRTGNGWSNDVEPSIVTVLNRSGSSFSAQTTGFAKELATDKWYFYTLGGGGTHEIWFEVLSVTCEADGSKILYVEPTDYTGSCDGGVPGQDEYGNVEVTAKCDGLDPYPVEWLEAGGRVGRATWFFPRGASYCEAGWLLDKICGSPQCGGN